MFLLVLLLLSWEVDCGPKEGQEGCLTLPDLGRDFRWNSSPAYQWDGRTKVGRSEVKHRWIDTSRWKLCFRQIKL